MNGTGRSAGVLLAASMVISTAACTAGNSGGGSASGSCVNQFTYQERTYRDVANVDFTVGAKLGVATQPPCDDTGGREKTDETGTAQTAYEVHGISPDMAIAVGDTPADASFFAAYSGADLPPEVQKLRAGS